MSRDPASVSRPHSTQVVTVFEKEQPMAGRPPEISSISSNADLVRPARDDAAPYRELLLELVAKQALHENMARYCRGMDRKELSLMKSTFWPESTEDHGMYVGMSHEFCEWACQVQAQSLYKANHYMTNMLIEFDGDRARRETAFIYIKVPIDGSPVDMLCGRYADLCERRGNEWKVLSRRCVWDLAQRLGPPGDYAALFGIPQTSTFGDLCPRDPTYADQW
jgi:hypothetical protein